MAGWMAPVAVARLPGGYRPEPVPRRTGHSQGPDLPVAAGAPLGCERVPVVAACRY